MIACEQARETSLRPAQDARHGRPSGRCEGIRVLPRQRASLDGLPAVEMVVCVDEVAALAYEFTDPSAARAWLDGAPLEPCAVREADEDERVAALAPCVELGTW